MLKSGLVLFVLLVLATGCAPEKSRSGVTKNSKPGVAQAGKAGITTTSQGKFTPDNATSQSGDEALAFAKDCAQKNNAIDPQLATGTKATVSEEIAVSSKPTLRMKVNYAVKANNAGKLDMDEKYEGNDLAKRIDLADAPFSGTNCTLQSPSEDGATQLSCQNYTPPFPEGKSGKKLNCTKYDPSLDGATVIVVKGKFKLASSKEVNATEVILKRTIQFGCNISDGTVTSSPNSVPATEEDTKIISADVPVLVSGYCSQAVLFHSNTKSTSDGKSIRASTLEVVE